MKLRQLIILGLLAGILAGCSQPTIPDPDAESTAAGSADDSMSDQAGMNDDGMGGGEFFEEEAPLTMIIYFDFDQSELRPEYADLLARHAAELSNNGRTTVRLEGHADERGSREYNIGLGERRSQSVRRMLLIQGASSEQISTVSFGEERPVAFGSDEDSWQQNRRVEIRYTN
jgi:peptidoglycan-associated lipoprotein